MSKLDLRLGDCTKILDDLIAEGVKVDLIITSPPYNLGFENRTSGDLVVKYNEYHDTMDYDEYESWQISILNKCYELLSDRGLIYYNHKERHIKGKFFHPINLIQKSKIQPLQTIIWNRVGGINFNIGRYVNSYESIIVGYKNEKEYMKIDKESEKHLDVWDIHPHKSYMQMATFPPELPERIIKGYMHYSNLKVLDPYLGSGTTGLVCNKLGVDFIGIEIDELYYNNACKRIRDLDTCGYVTMNAQKYENKLF